MDTMDARQRWLWEVGILGVVCILVPIFMALFQPQTLLGGWPASILAAAAVSLVAWSWVLLRSRSLFTEQPSIASQRHRESRKHPRLTPEPSGDPVQIRAQAAVQILELFQRKGRFVDFLREELGEYEDAQIGAAVRSVHAGCREVLEEIFSLAPIRAEEEGTEIEVPAGFDAREIRLAGQIAGKPPFHGILRHRGWKVTRVELPRLSKERQESMVVAPAEVDIE